MKSKYKMTSLAVAMVLGSAGVAAAQGGMTDRNGNSNGSQHVGNGSPARGTVIQGTTGMGAGPVRSSETGPNGSPNLPPTAKSGPVGDPSRDAGTPK
ncbi:hypothetical protein [Bradyrhizobium sp. S69]|jgi:hypothetical protein|uniref:hypothetical protein n=1 Tax=Bradyrhizobium sp. S69 TaxID=1641856 RepID=UPI00131B9784|nr:hypothetical protein [Bradyrhizobium sp. S69]